MKTRTIISIYIGVHLANLPTLLHAAPAQIEKLNSDTVEINGQNAEVRRVAEATYNRELPSTATPFSTPEPMRKAEVEETRLEFSSPDQNTHILDIGAGFSNSLGWVLWKTPGTSLCEIANTTHFENPDDGGDPFTYVVDPNTGKPRKVSAAEYAAWGQKTRLGMFSGDPTLSSTSEGGNAVLMSVRDSFSYFNASQEGFGIDYSQHNGDSELKVKGAVMFDVYLDPLYNRETSKINEGSPYRFWFRTGVEFDRDDGADQPTDRTSVYLLTNFQANPNQAAKPLGLDFLSRVISPQFVQLGVAYDHDEFTGDDDMRWIVGWQPQFYTYKKLGFIAESFGINRTMFFKKESFATLLAPSEALASTEDKASNFYSSIPMDIRLSGGSQILAEAFDEADSADEALVEWKAGLLFGYGPKLSKNESSTRWRIGYFAEGASPVFDPGETHIGHRFVAEVGLGNLSKEYIDQQTANNKAIKGKKSSFEFTSLPTTSLGAMTIFAEYRLGAPPPTYTKDEIFLVGTRIRF